MLQQEIEVSGYQKARILEIGSSIGGFLQFLHEAGCADVTGLELDQHALGFAKKHFPEYRFVHKPIEDFRPKKKFDLIFAFEVLEHLDDPRTALNHIHSLLSNKGNFIATSPFPFHKNIWGDKTHTYVLHPENWKKLLAEAGFTNVTTKPMSFMPGVWRLAPHLNTVLPFYIWHRWFVSTTLIVAQK